MTADFGVLNANSSLFGGCWPDRALHVNESVDAELTIAHLPRYVTRPDLCNIELT